MNKTLRRVITTVIVLVIAFLAFRNKFDFLSGSDNSTSPSPTPQSSATRVKAMVVASQRLENTLNVTGSILANESLNLQPEASGRIADLSLPEGKAVRKGTLLVQLNAEELLAQQEKLTYTKKLLEASEYRQRQLLEKEAISQEEYDQALTQLNTAEADLKLVEAQLEKTRILAPFDGIIGLRSVSEGSYVTPATTIAQFFDIDPVKLEFSIPGKYSQQVALGDRVYFSTETSDSLYAGMVYALEPQIDPETRTLTLRAKSPNPNGELLPGAFVKIELVLETREAALLVPTESVVPELGGHKVWLKRNGVATSTAVKIGTRLEREIEIVEGLTPGDTVITSGILQLTPGGPVTIIP
ncbi:MAG: efflux RND transporter periplasmic adaptor subunit [Bacteroidota bacterium]